MATPRRAAILPAEKWALPAQQARSRATRERILVAAERVFADKGYDGAKLADIAKAAGCSVGAVYFRYKDKDALFLAIAETYAVEARARFADFLRDAQTRAADDIVRDFVLRAVDTMRTHRGLFRAIIEGGFEHPDVLTVIFAFRDRIAQSLEELLRGRMARGRSARLGRAVRVMTQMVYGFLLIGVLNPRAPTKLDDDAAVAELANAACAHIKSVTVS